MPANTVRGFPYPLGTDPVADGDDAIHNLALAVDGRVGVIANASVSLDLTSNPTTSVTVTFPAGRFTAPPRVQTTGRTGSWVTYSGTATATSVNIAARAISGSAGSGTLAVDVLAIQ